LNFNKNPFPVNIFKQLQTFTIIAVTATEQNQLITSSIFFQHVTQVKTTYTLSTLPAMYLLCSACKQAMGLP